MQRTEVQSPGAPVPRDDVNTLGEVCADAALSFEPIMRVASGQFRLPIPNSLASYWSLVARVQGFFIRERVGRKRQTEGLSSAPPFRRRLIKRIGRG